MFDAIVVGARCAGSPTAMLLARLGYSILLVDRASFPSDTLSTHYVHQPGVAALARWGLVDRVAASNCPPVRRQLFDVGAFAYSGTPPHADGVADAYAPRRTVLDRILVEAAAEAGAELREGFTVEELVVEDGRVAGIRGRQGGGRSVVERARLVVGADGVHSLVARRVGAEAYDARPPRTCAYYAYWSDARVDGIELYPRPGRMLITGPTNDGDAIVIAYWPHAMFHEVRADVERSFAAVVDLAPSLAERLREGTRTSSFRGTGHLPFFLRRPFGPGWALVGDAGYHRDPITAAGISDAFRDAELLATAVDDGLAGRRPLEEALAGYELLRDERVRPMYELTHELAALEPPPPELQRRFAELAGDERAAGRFFGAIAGTVPVEEVFGPPPLEHSAAVA
jgi:flavin-dependent dehydrogenase